MTEHRPEFRFYYFTPLYAETVAFYRDVLQLSVYRSWSREGGDQGTIFVAPNGRGLIEIEAGNVQPVITGGVYVEVPDLERWHERVRGRGALIVKQLGVTSYGHRNFKVIDPSGLEVTFFQYLDEPG